MEYMQATWSYNGLFYCPKLLFSAIVIAVEALKKLRWLTLIYIKLILYLEMVFHSKPKYLSDGWPCLIKTLSILRKFHSEPTMHRKVTHKFPHTADN